MTKNSDLEQFFACFPEPALARDLTTILEDYRITARLQAEYPVLGEQIIAMNGHMVTKRPSLAALATDKQRAVELLGQSLTAGWTNEQAPVMIAAVLDQAVSRSQPLTSPQADIHETARVAADVYSLIDEAIPGPYESLPPFSAPLDQSKVEETIGNFNRAARKISEKLERQERSGEQQSSGQEQFRQPLEESAERSEQQQASEERVKDLLRALFKETGITPRAVESEIDALELNQLSTYLSDLETGIREGNALQNEHGTFLYHEWGIDIGDYRPNWTRVREQQLVGGSTEFYRATVQKYGGLIKCIRREFQMLRPEGLVKVREQFEGDDIDLDAAVQYFIDKRLRLSPSERNYVRTEKRTRDIAVAFLVDVSGSTSGATLTCEKEALIVMSEALEELGDAFAIYCFSGYGRDNSLFYTVKEFEDSYDERVQSKISQLRSQRSTRIAPAIRHTTLKLRGREEKTRLLILLSDGKPLDLEYHGDYAIEDTRMALREAGRYGIKSFCITVDREAAEYLPRMYANSRWVVIDEVAKLPNKITRIYRLFTT
jgi:nitric oxide reductase NorD protein